MADRPIDEVAGAAVAPNPAQIVVLGMHRSGTSGVTRLLNLAGAWFGPDGIATEANEENPKGFWERRDVRAMCDGLLAGGGFDWWKVDDFDLDRISSDELERGVGTFSEILDELDANRPWVVKEPRLCLLLPVLRPLLDAPVAVHVTREPLEVARSLQRRNGFSMAAGLALWELYTIRSFEASAGMPRLLVPYGDLMADPVGVTARMVDQLVGLGIEGLHHVADEQVLEFISPELHRQHRSASERPGLLNQQQVDLAAAIDDGSVLDRQLPGVSEAGLDELRALADHELLLTDHADLQREHEREQRLHARDLERLAAEQARAEGHLQRFREERERFEAYRADRLADLSRVRHELADAEREAAAARRAVEKAKAERDAMERYRDAEVARRRHVAQVADGAMANVDLRLKRYGASNVGRLANKAVKLRQLLTPGVEVAEKGPISRARRDLGEARERVAALAAQVPAPGQGPPPAPAEPDPAPGPVPLIRRTRPARAPSGRPRLAVVSWDVGHNPLGRANVLAEVLARRFDVELWGAQFERYNTDVWAPLRDADTPINVFPGRPFPEHLSVMADVVDHLGDVDALWISKPRLPSYLLGIMAKQARNRPLVLDVDDHELAFFAEDTGLDLDEVLALAGTEALELPFERAWTRACDGFIGAADQVTVSNEALQARYGGVIVPHARDERVFDPARYDREQARRRLGIGPEDRLLLFGGTPRIHKGVVEVLEALDRLGDDRYRVAMFGTKEFDDLRGRIGDLARWAIVLPAQPFSQLPELVAAADLACVLQDPTHPVTPYQMPAKISDALAMAVPCLVTPTPPLAGLIAEGVLQVLEEGDELHERIDRIFADATESRARADRGRELFLRSYSYEAVADQVAPMFEALIDDPPALSPELERLAEAPLRAFAGAPGVPDLPEPSTRTGRLPRALAGSPRPIEPGATFDVVMFWKQNDSGIYGRRQDMFVAELAASPRVGTIVHFDNPVTPEMVYQQYRSANGVADQRRLVARQSVARILRRRDDPGVHRHTFVYGGQTSARFRRRKRSDYVAYVRSVLARHGVGERNPVIVWTYPSNGDLPELIDALDPALVITDVVDDNRTWYQPGSPHIERIERNYEAVFARSDVVLANCKPVAEAMVPFGADAHVVPNGCELPSEEPVGPRPKVLRGLDGPVLTYVGNLSSRIDVDLLEGIARARPAWNLLLVGSAHLDQSILRLDALPNVHFAGVLPYPDVRVLLRHVDVALIAHVDDDMTRAMNPLKAYVYAAAGVPIVSTPVSNLAELGDLLTVAGDVDGFVTAVEEHLAAGRPVVDVELLRPHSWQDRVARVFDLIDEASGADA